MRSGRGTTVLLLSAALAVPRPSRADEGPAVRPSGWDDQRRTLRSYGSNLAYNFAGLVTTGNHVPLLVTAALTLPAFAWDDEVVALATCIAVSRLASNKHHFSDIVAGAGFGFGVGRAVVRRNGRPPDTPGTGDVDVSVVADPGPSGDGAGLAVHLVF